MKLQKNKIVSALLAAVLLASAFAGCGNGTNSSSNASSQSSGSAASSGASSNTAPTSTMTPVGEYPISTEPIKMTMFNMSAPNIIDWTTNDFTKYMEEKTNVFWDFIQAPDGSTVEKINLLMSSGNYPDAFMFATPNIAQYGIKEQLLMPLEDMIPEYMPNYWGYMQENPAYWTQQRQADGHTYGIASVNVCYHCRYFNKMWVNMNYIEEIGLGVPTTTAELHAVSKKFMELYPNGVPITGANIGWGEQFYDFLLGSFITNPGVRTAGDYLVVSPEGKVVTAANQSQYKDYLTFLNDMYKDGLIYDGGFTQSGDQYRSLVNQPDAPCLFIASGAIVNSIDPETNPDLYKAFRAVSPFEGPNGIRTATNFKYNDIQENKFVLSDKCPNPEAALRWADHFYTLEGYLQYQYGDNRDGTDYILNPPGEVGLNDLPALYKVLNVYTAEAQNHDWQDCGLIFAPEDIRFGEATDPNVDITTGAGLEKLLLIETKEKYEPFQQDPTKEFDVLPNRVKLTAEESDTLQTIAVEIKKYIDENRVAFVTGTKSVEADWDSYVSGFENIGLTQYLETYQIAWDRQQGK